jgi:hypothetical protein
MGMAFPVFKSQHLEAVSQALEIAEDRTADYYKFSWAQWKRHNYEVKTLSSLHRNEIIDHAFAVLNKGSRVIHRYDSTTKKRDFYFICLQDHQVLKALVRDRKLNLLSLLAYVFTHELVHIVRFCSFHGRFEATEDRREDEERIVHETTYRILKNVALPKLHHVLDAYHPHRICQVALS